MQNLTMKRNRNKIGPNLITCALMHCLSVYWLVNGLEFTELKECRSHQKRGQMYLKSSALILIVRKNLLL